MACLKYVGSSALSILILYSSLIIVTFIPGIGRAGEGVLTIEKAVQRALLKNPDITMTRLEVKRTQALLGQAESRFYPTLTWFSEFTAGDAPSAYLFKTIDQRTLPAGTDFNDPGNFTNMETGILAAVNLYNGGRDRLAVRMAGIGLESSQATAMVTQNQVVAGVIQVYFSILKAGAYGKIARHSVETVEEQLRIMNVRYKGGGVLKSDLLSLEVRLAEAKKNLVEAKNLYTTAITALTTLLAMELADGISLETDCQCPVAFPETYEEALKTAMEKRPIVRRIQKELERARLRVFHAKAGYRPKVNLGARYYLDSENTDFNRKNGNYTLGIRMEWNLFDGHALRWEWEAAKQELAKAEEMLKRVELSVKQDVKNAYTGYEDASQRLSVAASSIKSAAESLDLVKKRYQGGSEPVTRYLEAELARNRAEINQAAAYYDQKIAMSQIGRAMGVLAELWKEEK